MWNTKDEIQRKELNRALIGTIAIAVGLWLGGCTQGYKYYVGYSPVTAIDERQIMKAEHQRERERQEWEQEQRTLEAKYRGRY